MTTYATLHEVAAHLREVVTDPRATSQIIDFKKQGEPQSIFHNIFADIAGNNLIHATLPRMSSVATDLYREKLFTGTDYAREPRHLQFLYKIIRQEMVPDEAVAVLPEVDTAIDSLRDYQGQGDLIKYSTAVAKSAREMFSPSERFKIWKTMIYPVYEELLKQDRQDPERQNGDSDQSDGSGESQPSDQQSGEDNDSGKPGQRSPSEQSSQAGEGQPSDEERFGSFYENYRENHHPEPMSEEEEEQFHKDILEKKRTPLPRQPKPQDWLSDSVEAETGHSLNEQRSYNAEVIKWQSSIEAMREVYRTVINQRIAQKRGLSRQTYSEGAVLDPDRLVQTVIDVRNNVENPEAFRDYEQRRGENQTIGKTDYFFLFDVSGSMQQGEKSEAAASSAVIGLEGLAALQRDVEDAERDQGLDLELDIRTAMYTFGENVHCIKPLSTKVQPKERLDVYQALRNPNDDMTRDFLALEAVEQLPDDSDRRRIRW